MTRIPTMRCMGCLALLLGFGNYAATAQSEFNGSTSVEVAITFNAQRSLKLSSGENFWAEGGSIELGANAFHGLGLAADITGVRCSSIGSTGVSLALVTETFGPRYRWHDGHKVSVYAQGLVGEANGFSSLFPSTFGAQSDALALATQVGGGVDLTLTHHLTLRVLDAAWLRTQLPNSTSDVQNNLRVAAGLVYRMGQNSRRGR